MSVNYEHYKVFYHVAKCGNITAAAKELFLVQSTVSRAIQSLEHELGCTLFTRSVRGITLTREGRFLYSHLQPAVEHIQVAEEHLANLRQLNEGTLRIGVSELALDMLLTDFMAEFVGKYPGIHIQLSFSQPKKAAAELNAGTMDIAVLGSPFYDNQSLLIQPLMSSRLILIAGPLYSELRGEQIDFQKLRDYPILMMEEGTSVQLFTEQMANSAGFNIKPVWEFGAMVLLLSMVRMNLGLAFVPEYHVRQYLEDQSVFQVRLSQKLPEQKLCILTSKSMPQSAAMERFISELLLYRDSRIQEK